MTRNGSMRAVPALLSLTLHDWRRAWKGLQRATLDRLHPKGLTADPIGGAKWVVLTDAGLRRSETPVRTLFMRPE